MSDDVRTLVSETRFRSVRFVSADPDFRNVVLLGRDVEGRVIRETIGDAPSTVVIRAPRSWYYRAAWAIRSLWYRVRTWWRGTPDLPPGWPGEDDEREEGET